MNYAQALEYIDGFNKNGIRPGLERISLLLGRLGNPHEGGKCIHVAGTNGKGSTAAFIANILRAAGHKTGLFTSPHVEKINECINDGADISDAEFAGVTGVIKEAVGCDGYLQENITPFEILTAAAFLFFKRKGCDFIVLEAGMGGREDATNVIKGTLVSVITKISLDHTAFLGDTVAEIAAVKAGIIKTGCVTVLAPQIFPEARRVIESKAKEAGGRLVSADTPAVIYPADGRFRYFDYQGLKRLKIRMHGAHQVENAVTAVEAVKALAGTGFVINPRDIAAGLEKAGPACRLELVCENPPVYIDGAHNPDGIKALVSFFKERFPGKKIRFIFGVLKDKDYRLMAAELAEIAGAVFTVTPDSPRALPADAAAALFAVHGVGAAPCRSIAEAKKLCLEGADENSVICVCGSFYMAGQAKKEMCRRP